MLVCVQAAGCGRELSTALITTLPPAVSLLNLQCHCLSAEPCNANTTIQKEQSNLHKGLCLTLPCMLMHDHLIHP